MIDFDQKNSRRLDLIDKKYSVGLDPKEAAELETLKTEVYDEVQRRSPRSCEKLDEQEARLQRLKAKLAEKRDAR